MFVYIEIAVGLVAIFLVSRFLTGVQGERSYRRATIAIGVALAVVGLTILTIGARSPYTHANLAAGYDDRYGRTDQILVGTTGTFGMPDAGTSTDPVTRGASLFVTSGCVGCHTLSGGGGPVGKPIAGIDQPTLVQKVRQGPGGMPVFPATLLSDQQLAEIGAYVRSLPPAK